MNHSKVAILSAFFIVFIAASFGMAEFHGKTAYAETATAATTTATIAVCGVTPTQIAQITAIENDPTITYSQEIQQELALRKQLVSETIGCAEQDVQALQTDLQSATTSPESQTLQSQLLGDLNSASSFYNLELTKLKGVGISGSEAIAQEILDWRQSTFIPLSENVNNFILWSENQDLFDTAQVRMDQTQQAVSFLEIASPNADLQNALDAASTSFGDAQSENAAAKAGLAQGVSPDESLTFIKQSLASLSATYQGFSNVDTLIKGILPQ